MNKNSNDPGCLVSVVLLIIVGYGIWGWLMLAAQTAGELIK